MTRLPRSCRLCASTDVSIVHNFGEQPVAGYLDSSLPLALSALRFTNAIAMCLTCGFAQQAFDDAEEQLVVRVYGQYQPTYSMSTAVQAYVASFLDESLAVARLSSGGHVLEIGSNDGSVLAELHRRGYRAIGLDPSADTAAAASRGYEVVRDYFGAAASKRLLDRYGPAGLVISRHTLEHVFDPLDFLTGLATILGAEGRAVIEVPYLHLQLVNNQFQSMTFQHVSFFTVDTMQRMASSVGLDILDLRFSEMDAGSMIVTLGRTMPSVRGNGAVTDVIAFERAIQLDKPIGVAGYFAGLEAQRISVGRFLSDCGSGAVVAFGAGSKGQALLNMLSIDRDSVPFVIDDTPGTSGKFVPGVGTEVVALGDPRIANVRLVLVTAPSHVPEVARRARTRFSADISMLATTPAVHFVAPILPRPAPQLTMTKVT